MDLTTAYRLLASNMDDHLLWDVIADLYEEQGRHAEAIALRTIRADKSPRIPHITKVDISKVTLHIYLWYNESHYNRATIKACESSSLPTHVIKYIWDKMRPDLSTSKTPSIVQYSTLRTAMESLISYHVDNRVCT